MAPNTFPAMAKIGGQYVNSHFVVTEAVRHGYTEGIALDVSGFVSEGSGENIFLLRRGQLLTPPQGGSILDGITRRCVITLAKELGLDVQQEFIPRELLYVADEVFFCGTAAEITPIRSVDGVVVGDGRRGNVTTQLSEAFFDIVEGRVPDRHGWLTMVPM
jgi:branched-chain amino acid aminotransferase